MQKSLRLIHHDGFIPLCRTDVVLIGAALFLDERSFLEVARRRRYEVRNMVGACSLQPRRRIRVLCEYLCSSLNTVYPKCERQIIIYEGPTQIFL